MATATTLQRSTVYLDPELHMALKIQAAETKSNISALINEAVRSALRDDLEDLTVFEERKNDPTIPFEEMLKRLDLDGKI